MISLRCKRLLNKHMTENYLIWFVSKNIEVKHLSVSINL